MKITRQGYIQRYLKSLTVVLAGAAVTCTFLGAAFFLAMQQIENMGENGVEIAAASQELARQRVAEAQAQYRQQQEAAQARILSEAKPRQEIGITAATPHTRTTDHRKTAQRTFATVYQAPADCGQWQSDAHMVECVNHRMRAKAVFLAQSADYNQ